MRTRRRSATVLVTALTAMTIVPVVPSFATEVAPPETITATVEDLTGTVDAPSATASVDLRPGADPVASEPVITDVAFSTVGFRLPDGVEQVMVRTREPDGAWRGWLPVDRVAVDLDGPDAGAPGALQETTELSEPVWVGPSDAFQVAFDAGVAGDPDALVEELAVELIDTLGQNEGLVAKAVRHLTPRPVVAPAEAAAGRPPIISRAGWGADESWRQWAPSYRTPAFAVLHHTAGSNSYTKAQSAAVVRGIYSYHARTLGWGDIGYNVLVDKYGQVFEGRYGGVDRGVIGAHAKGFNTGSFGVSVMGNYDTVDIPSVALESVARVIAWNYGVHGIPAAASRTISVNGRTINTLAAHRNVGSTACPGRYLYARMGALRSRVATLVGSSAPGPTPASVPATRFVDVARAHTHYATIESAAQRRLTAGCSSSRYCPDRGVTRAQMATFVARAAQLPTLDASATVFRDVSGVHAASIASLYASGITSGCGPARFCPDRTVTRAQMATVLAEAFDIPHARERFSDVSRGSMHAGAIGGLVEAGIVDGYGDGTFRPDAPVSRAAMATFLVRALGRR